MTINNVYTKMNSTYIQNLIYLTHRWAVRVLNHTIILYITRKFVIYEILKEVKAYSTLG